MSAPPAAPPPAVPARMRGARRPVRLLLVLLVLAGAVAPAPPAAAQKFDGLAPTPPMGWNSWNRFGCAVDERLIRATADAMVASGMRDAGYRYVVIDDCWHGERDEQGFLRPDPARFPSGMKALADYVHALGLQFGLYSDAGWQTCGGRPGSRGREYQDETAAILTNRDVIAVDQDPLGIQGFRHRRSGDLEVWVRPLAAGDWAVAFLNRGPAPLALRFDWPGEAIEDTLSHRRLDAGATTYRIRDLWAGSDRGDTRVPLKAEIPPHDVLVLRLAQQPAEALTDR